MDTGSLRSSLPATAAAPARVAVRPERNNLDRSATALQGPNLLFERGAILALPRGNLRLLFVGTEFGSNSPAHLICYAAISTRLQEERKHP